MGRVISTVALRSTGKRFLWLPALVIAMVILAIATAGAETGRITLKVTDNDILVQDAGVSIHTPAGESLDTQARTNMEGIATFVAQAGSYKFCVNHYGDRTWSHVVHTLPNDETRVNLALEQLAADKTLDPNPVRFDGRPPEEEPVMLASLTGVTGILTQSTVATVNRDKLYWFVNDHLGTPLMIVDENQTVVWEGAHSPFGDTARTVNTTENKFRFPGQYFDTESGLHYNYHRYYDTSLGRYLRADPIGLAGGINLFVYAEMNPINVSDQFGLLTGSYHEATGGGWASAPPRYNPSANVLENLLPSIGTVDPAKLKKAADKSSGPLAFYGAGASLLVAGAEIAKLGSGIMVTGGPIGWIGGGAVTLTGASMSVVGLSSLYLGYQVQQDVQYKLIDLPEILQEQGGGYCESQ